MLPKRALSNIDIIKYAIKNIPYFRGVYMKDELPKYPNNLESGIINLANSTSKGTHWIAYFKRGLSSYYFDSFGNLKPPLEVVRYLGKNINYNYNRYQKFGTVNCGHLCLEFLSVITRSGVITKAETCPNLNVPICLT